MNNKPSDIAVVGDKDSVLAFKSIGMDARPVSDEYAAAGEIRKLAENGTKVIYITEQFAELISDTIDKYKTKPYPIIIPIPYSRGSNGFGMKNLKKDVEKAIGADILFNK